MGPYLRRLGALAALACVFAAGLSLAPASARRAEGAAPPAERNVLSAQFEHHLRGWSAYRAVLRQTPRGVTGRGGRVLPRYVHVPRFWIYANPRPIRRTVRDQVYRATASVRSLGKGQPVCLKLRELSGSAQVAAAQGCVWAVKRWRTVRVAYTSGRDGSRLGFSIRASRRIGFEVDRVELSERTLAGKPCKKACTTSTTTTPTTTTAPTTSTVTTTTTPTTTTASPPPPSTNGRWYSPDSPFNQAIPVGANADSNSSAMVQRLVAGAVNGFPIAARAWTFPVYAANASSPRVDVSLTASWAAARVMSGVPIPSGATPDPAGDQSLTVIDPATNCEYDFWGASRGADGKWSAWWANATTMNTDGIYDGGWSARASGFANGLGLVRPEELAAGRIDHALVFAFPDTKEGGPVWPATHSDGHSTLPGAIPEGARAQLDPSLDLDALGLNPWQKIVARALQTYGMFLSDGGGTTSLYAVNTQSTTTAYPWGDETYPLMPTSLLSHMQVLTLPPQNANPPSFLVSTPCAKLF